MDNHQNIIKRNINQIMKDNNKKSENSLKKHKITSRRCSFTKYKKKSQKGYLEKTIKKKCILNSSCYESDCIICDNSFCDKHCIRNHLGTICNRCSEHFMSHLDIKNDPTFKEYNAESKEILVVCDKEKNQITFKEDI